MTDGVSDRGENPLRSHCPREELSRRSIGMETLPDTSKIKSGRFCASCKVQSATVPSERPEAVTTNHIAARSDAATLFNAPASDNLSGQIGTQDPAQSSASNAFVAPSNPTPLFVSF